MTPRRKRLFVVLGILGGVAASVSLAMMASRENIMFYYDPSQVVAGKAPAAKRFRIGGMVVKGSVERKPGDLQVRFVLSDFAHEVPVEYTGVLPDLFREGQGIIAHGTMNAQGAFVADEVLAKHDEKYMPPEVAASLKNKAAATSPLPLKSVDAEIWPALAISMTPSTETSAVSFCSETKSLRRGGMTVRTAWGRTTRRIVDVGVSPSERAARSWPWGTELMPARNTSET